MKIQFLTMPLHRLLMETYNVGHCCCEDSIHDKWTAFGCIVGGEEVIQLFSGAKISQEILKFLVLRSWIKSNTASVLDFGCIQMHSPSNLCRHSLYNLWFPLTNPFLYTFNRHFIEQRSSRSPSLMRKCSGFDQMTVSRAKKGES